MKDCLVQKKSPLANQEIPAAGSRKLESYNHATRVKPSELFNMELSARPDLALNKLQNKFMKTAEKQLVTKNRTKKQLKETYLALERLNKRLLEIIRDEHATIPPGLWEKLKNYKYLKTKLKYTTCTKGALYVVTTILGQRMEPLKKRIKACNKKFRTNMDQTMNARVDSSQEAKLLIDTYKKLKGVKRGVSHPIMGAHIGDDPNKEIIRDYDLLQEELAKIGKQRFAAVQLPPLTEFTEHFLCNMPTSTASKTLTQYLRELEPTLVNLLRRAPKGKARGEDKFPIELAQLADHTGRTAYIRLVTRCMKLGRLPADFKKINTALLYKTNENPNLLNKRRPIGLQCRSRAFMERILNVILEDIVGSKIGKFQFGFKAGSQTADAQLLVVATQEHTKNHGRTIHGTTIGNHILLFIDFEDAYTSIDFERMWTILEYRGVHPSIIKLIKQMHDVEMAYILWVGKSKYFQIKKGLIQGSVIAPKLFNLYLDCLAFELERQLNPFPIAEDLNLVQADWADDMCLILTSNAQLEKAIEIVEQWNTDTGMIVKIKPLDQTAPLSRGIKEQTKTAIATPKKLNKTFKITQKKKRQKQPPSYRRNPLDALDKKRRII